MSEYCFQIPEKLGTESPLPSAVSLHPCRFLGFVSQAVPITFHKQPGIPLRNPFPFSQGNLSPGAAKIYVVNPKLWTFKCSYSIEASLRTFLEKKLPGPLSNLWSKSCFALYRGPGLPPSHHGFPFPS